MTLGNFLKFAQKIRISEILLTVLLALSIWENRPPTVYVNKTKGVQGETLYNLCVKQHRWGTETHCSQGAANYEFVKAQLDRVQQQQENSSIKAEWRWIVY